MNSHYFKTVDSLLEFIDRETKRFIGVYESKMVLYSYNRMTVEELVQEVFIKIFKTVDWKGVNKTYIRNCVRTVCIDKYRKMCEVDPRESMGILDEDEEISFETLELLVSEEDTFRDTIRLRDLKAFENRERDVLEHLLCHCSNRETYELLGISKMTFYRTINKILKEHDTI